VADAARRDDNRRRAQLEVAGDRARGGVSALGVGRLENAAADTGDGPFLHDELVDLVAKRELDEPALLARQNRLGEHAHHLRAGAPGEVEPRHRVAVAERAPVAALRPAHERHDP
jgi:hypothetical protein